MDLPPELIGAVARREAVLFAGAGLSATLGVPTFGQLVDAWASEVGFDRDLFRLHGDAPTLADFVKDQLPGPKYEDLLSRLARSFDRSDARVRRSAVHRLIVSLDFQLIYTTNYDHHIESAYRLAGKQLQVVVALQDMKGIDRSIPQLIKYHGDFDDPKTIVLTEASYFDRLQLDSPLDVRFLADVIGRPILFVGYSLTDVNLRYFLYRLSVLWRTAPSAAPKSYLVVPQHNPVQSRVMSTRGIETIVADAPTPADGLRMVLTTLNRAVRKLRPSN